MNCAYPTSGPRLIQNSSRSVSVSATVALAWKTRESRRISRMLGSCGSGLGLARPAQHGPIDVRPQVFAADGAVGSAFDSRASLRRHLPLPACPLGNEDRWRAD